MKLSEKLLGKNALKWQFSAGRIWCDSSLVVAVKARAIITFTSYWPASAVMGRARGEHHISWSIFKHVQTLYYYILFSNIRIARRLVQSDIHNQICNVLRWIQTTSLHPEVIFFGCQKSLIEATFGFMKKRGHFATRYWFPLQDVGLKTQLNVMEGTHEEPCHESWRSIWLRTQLPLEP